LITPSPWGDRIFAAVARLAAIVTLLMMGGIIISLFISSWPTIKALGWSFIVSPDWDPPADLYGALVPIYGTIVTSLIALII
ncbi:phosphate ABC transporter permease subunit PstC, partial [Acinetobacter baumannii]